MSIRQKQPKPLKYSDAGVDIDAGDALIGDIAPHAKRTRRAGADSDLGGFGGLFDLKAAGFTDPVLSPEPMVLAPSLNLPNRLVCIAALALIWWLCARTIFWHKAQYRCFFLIILRPEN